MKTLFILALTLMSFTALADTGANSSLICINSAKDIDTKGYFHYVFPNGPMKAGSVVQIVDYANKYRIIQATVTKSTASIIVLENKISGFTLAIDTTKSFKPGRGFGDAAWPAYVTHRNQRDYKIECALSGGIELE